MTVPSEGVGTALVSAARSTGRTCRRASRSACWWARGLACVTLAWPPRRQADLRRPDREPGGPDHAVVHPRRDRALPMTVLRRRLDFRQLALLGLVDSVVRSAPRSSSRPSLGLDAEALVFGGLPGMSRCPLALISPRCRCRAGHGRACATSSLRRSCDARLLLVGGLPQRRLRHRRRPPRRRPGRHLLARLPARGRVPEQDQPGHEPGGLPGSGANGRPGRDVRPAPRMVGASREIFPLLAALVLLAPVIVPWVFGPAWEPAVRAHPDPGRRRSGHRGDRCRGHGLDGHRPDPAHARLRRGSLRGLRRGVLFASRSGLTAVCIAAWRPHVFVVVAYQVLLRGRAERTLRFLWADISAASVSCVALVAVALPVALALDQADLAAGCSMADMARSVRSRTLGTRSPTVFQESLAPVTYMHSADIKAFVAATAASCAHRRTPKSPRVGLREKADGKIMFSPTSTSAATPPSTWASPSTTARCGTRSIPAAANTGATPVRPDDSLERPLHRPPTVQPGTS